MLVEHNYPSNMMVWNFLLLFFCTHFWKQRKWSTTEQEAYGDHYAITKWNYYLQGADIVVTNDHKLLNRFLNGKNANKFNRWGMELATYNITFGWVSGAHNKAADCLSCLVELPQNTPILINMLSVMNTDGPTFNTISQTHQCLSPDNSTSQPDIIPEVSKVTDPTPKSLTADRLEALLQMQKTNPFCRRISKCLSNGKAPQHEMNLFTHVRGLLYKHLTSLIQVRNSLLLVITQVLEIHCFSWSSQ